MKKSYFNLLLSILCILPIFSFAVGTQLPIKENVDYRVITPKVLLPSHHNKINVTEFFSYHCVHCAVMDHKLAEWSSIHKNVDFNQIQVVWGNYFITYAKINATINIMNRSDLNSVIFKAVQEDRNNVEDEAVLKDVLQKKLNSKDYNNFMTIYGSFSVSTKPNEYRKYSEAFDVQETPLIVVDNRYIINPATPDRFIFVLDSLIQKIVANKG